MRAKTNSPAKRIKCVAQVMDAKKRMGTLRPDEVYAGPLDLAKRILRETGVRGLYRGHVACLLREIPGNAAWFGVYEATVRWIQESNGYANRQEVPLVLKGLAGALGGACYWALPYPADTIKSRLQIDSRYEGWSIRMVFRKILAEEGVRGLYRGLGVTLVRAPPEHFILFMLYEWIDESLHKF